MHLLIIAGFFYPHRGGYERYIEETSKRLVQAGFRVSIVTCNTESAIDEEVRNGITILRLPCWNLLGGTYPIPKPFPFFFRLSKYISKHPVDIINAHTRFFITSFFAWVLARHYKRLFVHTEHGTDHVFLPSLLNRGLAWLYDQTFGRIIIHQADLLIGISQASLQFAHQLGGKDGIVARNGVDLAFFRPLERSANKKLRILFVGRLIAAKGVQDLIKAFVTLRPTYPNTELRIAGTGNYESALRTLAANIPDILFLGSLDQERILKEFQQADIVVNPSYGEGLPATVLEAGACACAVIATDVGGTSEIIIDKENGLLTSPKDTSELIDCTATLYQDPDLRTKLGKNLLATIQRSYSWETAVKQLDTSLNALLTHDSN